MSNYPPSLVDTTTSKTDSLTSPSVVSLFVWHNTLVNPQRIGGKSYFYATVCASLLLATAPDVCDSPQFDRPTRDPSSRGAPLGVGGQEFEFRASELEPGARATLPPLILNLRPAPKPSFRSEITSRERQWLESSGRFFFFFFPLSLWPCSLTVRSEERRCIHFFFFFFGKLFVVKC